MIRLYYLEKEQIPFQDQDKEDMIAILAFSINISFNGQTQILIGELHKSLLQLHKACLEQGQEGWHNSKFLYDNSS